MRTYFIQNVRRWPRVFTVILLLAIVDGVTNALLYSSVLSQRTANIVIAAVAVVLAIGIYMWFAGNGSSLGLLAELFDSLEGREPAPEPETTDDDPEYYDDEEEIDPEIDEEPEPEEGDFVEPTDEHDEHES